MSDEKKGLKLHDDDKLFEHESYAMVGFSRITGDPGRLFGSSVANTQTFVRRAKRQHSLGRDWYFGKAEPIIEVDLSSAQFAELLTSMNVGNGVPCTLRWIEGRKMADPPDELLESKQVRTDFKEKCQVAARKMEDSKKQIEEILAKKNITQADRKDIESRLAMIVQEVRSNMPFWLEQFNQAAEKVVTAAKAEVDAFMTHAVMAAGWKALKEGDASRPPVPQLTTGSDEVKVCMMSKQLHTFAENRKAATREAGNIYGEQGDTYPIFGEYGDASYATIKAASDALLQAFEDGWDAAVCAMREQREAAGK